MDVPVNAEVHCTEGLCGRSTYIILNPRTEQVTHLVVKQKRSPHTERLVPIDAVVETSPNTIWLRCSERELETMEPFMETDFVRSDIPEYRGDPYAMWPYVIPKTVEVPVIHEHLPPGELAVRRGAQVKARDGHVGQVDEFLVDPTTGYITHLVLREGHLWGQKDVTIPVSQIDHIEEDIVYLKLDKRSIEALPAIPIWRR